MVDQIKITVIATGFDEARARLAGLMAKPAVPAEPEGIVSEVPEEKEKKEEEEKKVKPPEEEAPPDELEELDIPAFLRQGR
jgi:hypothetical protein